MPKQDLFNPLKEHVVKMEDDYEIKWPMLPGRDIYSMPSLTGLNRSPISTHIDFVTSDLQKPEVEQPMINVGEPVAPMPEPESPPYDVEKVVEALIVDGSLVYLHPKGPDSEGKDGIDSGLLQRVEIITPDWFLQRFGVNREGEDITREWVREGDKWTVQDYADYDIEEEDESKREPIGEPMTISDERVYLFPNGRGLLYMAQWTFRRLEEIELRLRKATNAAIVIVVSGYIGDRGQAKEAIEKEGEHTLFMPKQATIDLVANTALADQFLADFRNLLPRYQEQLKIVNTAENAEMSGVARRLVMKPMFAFTEKLKDQTSQIFREAFDYELDFQSTVTRTSDEIRADFELLGEYYQKGIIDQRDYVRRAKALLP